MAIKGKTRSKTKAKGHLAGRPPRREPVPVPVPFFLRRWVQLVAVFLLGVGVLAMGVWVTNGLRQDRDEKAAAAAAATRAAALQKWQSEVEVQLGTVAQMQSGSGTLQPPPVSPEVGAAVDALAQGKKPTSKPQDLKKTADAVNDIAVKTKPHKMRVGYHNHTTDFNRIDGEYWWNLFADQLGVVPESAVPAIAALLVIPIALLVVNAVAMLPGRFAAKLQPAGVLRTE